MGENLLPPRRGISRAILVVTVIVVILVAGIGIAATINIHNSSSASQTASSTSTSISSSTIRSTIESSSSSSSSSSITTYLANTTETFPAGSTFDTLVLGNITVTCYECGGEELNNSQFQGYSDGGPYTMQFPLRGNGSATYSYGVMDSPVTWTFSKNTVNGTLEVKVYAEDSLIFDRNTTSPYGTLSGYWLLTGCACG